MAGAPGDDALPTVAIRPQFDWDAAADGTPVQRHAAEPVCLDAASVASTPVAPIGQQIGTQLAVLCTGHGPHGQAAAVLAAQHLAQALSNALEPDTFETSPGLVTAVFERAFVSCHSKLCASAGLDASHSGASALALVLAAGHPSASDGCIVAASAGNCRAVLARAHSDASHPDRHSASAAFDQSAMAAALDAIQLSADALLDAPLERCRVESLGARVENLPLSGPATGAAASAGAASSCCQRLALWEGGSVVDAPASRLLGCTAAQAAGVIALPVVLRWRRCASLDKFIIIGSEGLWRAFSNEEAVEFVQRYCETAAAATAASAAAVGSYGLGVADALTLEAQERLKLRQAQAVIPDVTAMVLPLASEYSVSTAVCRNAAGTAQQAATAGGTQEQNGDGKLPSAARSNAEAVLLARSWAAEPHICPASAAAAAPFPALLPYLRSHPWPMTPAASLAVGRLLRRVPPPRRSSLGFGFALSRRQSSELELSRDTEWSSDSNVSFTSEEQAVVLHKVRLNGHLSGRPEMESMLYGSATSGRPDTTVARHLGPPSPMPRAHSINVSQLSLATSRRASNSSGALASSTAGTLGYSQDFGGRYGQGFGNSSQGSLSTASAPPFSSNSLRKARSYQALAALATSSAHLNTQSSSSAPASDTTHSLAAAAHGTSRVANSAAPGNAAGPMFPAFRSAFATAGSEAMAALGGAARGFASSGKGAAATSSSGAVLGSSSANNTGRSSTESFPGLMEAEQAAALASLLATEQQQQPSNAYTRMAASVRQLLSAPGSSAPGSPLSSAADGAAAGSDHAPQQSLGLWQGWQGQQPQQAQQGQHSQQALQRLQGLQLLLPQAAAEGSWVSSSALQAGPGSNIDSEDHVSSPVGSTSSAAASDRVHALAGDLAQMDSKKAWKNRPEPCVHNGMRKGYLPRHTSMPSLTHHYSIDSEPQSAATAAAYARHSADTTQLQTAAGAAEGNKPWVRPPPLLVVAQHAPTAPGSPLIFGALSAPHPMERTQSARARRALTHDMSSASLSESLVGSQAEVGSPVGQGSGFWVSGHQAAEPAGKQRQQELAFAGAFAPHADVGSFEVGSPREEGQVHAGKPHGSTSSTTSMEASLSHSLHSRQYVRSASFNVGSPAEEHKMHGGVSFGSACSTPTGVASQQQHTRRPPSRALTFPQPGANRVQCTAQVPAAPSSATVPPAAAIAVPVGGSIEHLLSYQGSITKVHLQQQSSATRAHSVPLDFHTLADAAAAAAANAPAKAAASAMGGSMATQASGPSSAATSAAASTGASSGTTEAALLGAPSPSNGNSSGSSGSSVQGRLEKSLLPPVWTSVQPGKQGVCAPSSFGSSGTAISAGAATDSAAPAASQVAATQTVPALGAAPMAVPIGSSAPALLSHSRSAMSAPASVSFQKPSHIMQLPVLQESDSEADATSDSEADNASETDSNGGRDSSHSRAFQHLNSTELQQPAAATLQIAPLSHLPPHILSEAQPHRSQASNSSMESISEATFDCNTTSSSTCRQADSAMTEEGHSAIPSHEVSYQVSNQAANEAANDADAARGAADADASSPGRLRVRSFEFSRHHTLDQQQRSSARLNASPPRVFGKPSSRLSTSAPVRTSADVLLAAAATAAGDVGEEGARPALQLGSAFGTGDAQGFGTGDASAVGAGDTYSCGMRSARGYRAAFASSGALVSLGLGSLGPAGLLWDGGEEGRVHRGSSLSLLLQQGLQAMTELDVLGECGEGSRAAGSASMAPATAY